MKYCENCGAKLEENDKFCEQCGKVVEELEPTEQAKSEKSTEVKEEILPKKKEQAQKQKGKSLSSTYLKKEKRVPKTKESAQKQERKSLTSKQRIIGVSVIGIILFIFSTYQLGAFIYSPERQTDKIVEAVSSKDSDRLADVITSTDSNFEVTSENLANFVSYLEENPDYLSEMVYELSDYGTYDSFYIEEAGKKFGLYPAYELMMTPIYGTIYTNAKGVAISLGEEELFLSDSEDFMREIGPFAPGILKFTAAGEVNGFPLSITEEVTWLSGNYYNEVDLALTGQYFSVRSDLDNADVYVNDQVIGQLEDGFGEFGPIQIEDDMEIYVTQTFGEEKVSSEIARLTKDDSIYEFYDVVLGSGNEAARLLSDSYMKASQLTRNYESYADEYTKFFDPEGPAYEDQRLSFLSYGETIEADEDVNRVDYEVTPNKIERTASNAFDIDYEVTYRTYYSYGADKEDGLKHYSKEATIVFEPTNHPDRDYDMFVYEIRNEELLYEE